MQKKDKEKVFGGDWTEDMLREFLHANSYDGSDPDYIAAIRAYRHMVPDVFADYITLFVAEGHNVNAKHVDGATILQTISSHANGADYAGTLTAAGAE
ncbi:MAG: PA4642 family protein [Bacterioplanes sp.]|nr:PA4642 family protein [Bacterioplanes sp.]